MKLKIVILIILLALTVPVFSDNSEDPKPVLKKGDVIRFIKTFPLLKEDFKKFEIKYDNKSGAVNYPKALKASGEFLSILKKHGWDEHFFSKMAVISMGYSMLTAGKEMKNADPQFEKSIQELKSNTHLSEEMKKQMIDQLMKVKGIMKNQQQVIKKMVPKEDMALIKPRLKELKTLFDNKKKK